MVPSANPCVPPAPCRAQLRRPACRPAGASRASPPRNCPCPRHAGSSRRPRAFSRRRPTVGMQRRRQQRKAGQQATAGGPAHAREAAVPAAAKAAGPRRERAGRAHSDAAAIAISASAATRMLRRPGRSHRAEVPSGQSASAFPGGPAIEPRRQAARATPPGPARTLYLISTAGDFRVVSDYRVREASAYSALVLSTLQVLFIHCTNIYWPPTMCQAESPSPPGAHLLMGVDGGDGL